MTINTTLNPQRDKYIFRYLWKWKVATTNMIYLTFFKNVTPNTAYKRLYKLRKHRFIKLVMSNSMSHKFWSLDTNGFNFVKNFLPELKDCGYKSEAPSHDLLCALVQQGALFYKTVTGLEIITEQQLRRIESEFLPGWVPKSAMHRPDGYWRILKDKIIALEVELNQKSKKRLDRTLNFYESRDDINCIVWVVPGKSDAQKILRQSSEISHRLLEKHSIVLLKDFYSYFWDAKVSFGTFVGSKIEDILIPSPVLSVSAGSNTYHRQLLSNGFLNTRKHSKLFNNLSTVISG